MAKNKSKSNIALSVHIATYTASMMIVVCFPIIIFTYFNPIYTSDAFLSNIVSLFIWALINGVFHFMTDFYTSKWSSRLYQANDFHNFFVVVGLDQMIHYLCLFATFPVLQVH